jgi:type II secretory ATPase GspE/PulE/Tfp pilus assembly ATPase PilB-like protein
MVRVNERFRRLVVDHTPANVLRQEAIKDGMRPIRHDGWTKIKAGITTIDEVLRVTMEDEFVDYEDI